MAIAHVHLTPWAPGSNLVVQVYRAIDNQPGMQQEAICYQWFKQRLILSFSERSQIKEDTVKPSVPAREFNLKAYAAKITWHHDQASLGLKPRLTNHPSQAARTATLPTAPPGQALRRQVFTNLLHLTAAERNFSQWQNWVFCLFSTYSRLATNQLTCTHTDTPFNSC